MKLHFNHAQVAALLAHSEAATQRSPSYDQLDDKAYRKVGAPEREFPEADDIDGSKIPAGLWLVGDQGIYLMSNSNPGLLKEGGGNVVVYADEADPEKQPDTWWDVKRRSFGGDDGADFLSADAIRKALLATQGERFYLGVSARGISAPYLAPAEPAPTTKPKAAAAKPALKPKAPQKLKAAGKGKALS